MKDIVTQLRTNSECLAPSIMLAAADEIERLRVELDRLRPLMLRENSEIQQVRAERDEARREVCIRLGWHFQIVAELEARTDDKHHTWDRFKEAAYRKWDCFKEEK